MAVLFRIWRHPVPCLQNSAFDAKAKLMTDQNLPPHSAAFSHRIAVATLPASGDVLKLALTAQDREAIARAYDLPSIESFVIDGRVTPDGRGGATMRGSFSAAFHQLCVVSLEPFPVKLQDKLSIAYATGTSMRLSDGEEILIEPTGDDPPEPVEAGMIDIGAVVCEFFALALDPYPRKPGASFTAPAPALPISPFAALGALKTNKET